jgi:hypothetical protein
LWKAKGITLRGHDETEDSKNKGNFSELMELRSKDNILIRRHLMDKEKKFKYSTAKFQNELTEIISSQIKSEIALKVKNSNIFSLIVDETQDISKHEQVSIVLRYVDDQLKVYESFIGFYRAENTDGETLVALIISALKSIDLGIGNVRAQCYDGAGNMSGPYKGVAARILKDNPLAMYIHCHAHILNLCISG